MSNKEKNASVDYLGKKIRIFGNKRPDLILAWLPSVAELQLKGQETGS